MTHNNLVFHSDYDLLLGVLFTKRDEVVTAVITNDLISVTALLLLGTELEVLRPLQCEVLLCLTLLALQTQDDFTGGLGLLVEHGLSLTSETHLLGVVTALPLGEVGCLPRLVLGDLVDLVRAALASGAVRFAFFGHVDHFDLDMIRAREGDDGHTKSATNKTLPMTDVQSHPGEMDRKGTRRSLVMISSRGTRIYFTQRIENIFPPHPRVPFPPGSLSGSDRDDKRR